MTPLGIGLGIGVPLVRKTQPLTAPESLAGIVRQHKASSGLWQDSSRTIPVGSNLDSVGAWDDLIGGNHVIQTTTAKKPTYKNAAYPFPAVYFDGVDDWLRGSAPGAPSGDDISSTSYYVIYPGLLNTNQNPAAWVNSANTNNNQYIQLRGVNSFRWQKVDNAGVAGTGGNNNKATLILNRPYVVIGRLKNTLARIRVNGIIDAETVLDVGALVLDQFCMGALVRGAVPSVSFPFTGGIVECGSYSRDLTDDEGASISTYLLNKYKV